MKEIAAWAIQHWHWITSFLALLGFLLGLIANIRLDGHHEDYQRQTSRQPRL